jgi:hypothetical protein
VIFGRSGEVAYLRGELAKAHARYEQLVATVVTLKQERFVVEPVSGLDAPLPEAEHEVSPSIDVVIEEFADLSPRPAEVRRQLTKFAALKATQGKSEAEIVALIRHGGSGESDDEEGFI